MLLQELVLLILGKHVKYINRLAQVHWSRTSLSWLTQSLDARPSLPRSPEYLSSRSLRYDREGLIYMVIGKQAVSMCRRDCRLNATQLCNAAGLINAVRRNYLKILKRRCDITYMNYAIGPKQSWVPFKDGVFLCQVLKLCDIMKPLFLQASLHAPGEEQNYILNEQSTKLKRRSTNVKRRSTNVKRQGTNLKLPDGYKALQCGDNRLVYRPSTRKVHAVQLLKLSNITKPRTKLTRFLSQNCAIVKEVLKGHREAQGMYIGFDDARLLCQAFRLREDLVDKIVRQETVTDTNYDSNFHSILFYDGTYDLETDDFKNQGTMVGFPGNHVNGPEIAATDPSDKYSPANILHADAFLAPGSQSYLQLLNDAQ